MKPLCHAQRLLAVAFALFTAACAHHQEELMEQAAAGNDAAQYELGRRLLLGRKGFTADPALGFAWLKQAALQGNANAMAAMGICYEYGLGTTTSAEEAEEWYNKAVDAGNPNACIPLIRQEMKKGNPNCVAGALTPPAERGAAAAQLVLSSIYLNDASPKKQELGIRYLRFAAMQGSAEACVRMGLCYAVGKGVPQNDLLARGWFENAKEAGSGRTAALIRAAAEEE